MDLGALLSNIGVLAVLLMLSGFFSGSETALSSLTKLDLERLRRDQKSKTSKSILGFTDNPRRLFNTILLGNTFINTAFATITASLVAIVAGGAHSPIGPTSTPATHAGSKGSISRRSGTIRKSWP